MSQQQLKVKEQINDNKQLGDLPSWDLTHFYSNSKSNEIEQDIAKLQKLCLQFRSNYEGKMAGLTGDQFAQALRDYEVIEDLSGKLGSYAYLLYAEQVTHEENSRFFQNISEKLTDIGKELIFFSLEINRLDDAIIEKQYAESEAFRYFKPWIRDCRSFRPYQLSDELETLLHDKSVTGRQSWVRLFDETLAGLRFPYEGEELTCAAILDKLSNPDGAIRKKAAKSFGEILGKNNRLFVQIMNVLIKDKSIEDQWRKFPKPISSRNVSNYIEDSVVEALIESVKSNYGRLSHRYYKLKAGWLGKTQLDYWDRNAPLPNQEERIIPWTEAVDIVLGAYRRFSPHMADIGQQFFDKNWIDAPVRDGKESGAFSHSTVPSVHPYILMNYQGKTRDVMTLAHELGHGVHQCLSSKMGIMAYTPLTLAETASVFGEQLTFRALLDRQQDHQKRQLMIAQKVEDMLNTVVRQVAFCEFERQLHDLRKDGELSAETINKTWMKVQSESLGDGIRYEDEYQFYWSYISHFIHSPFYVYSYAFGDCLVNALYGVYQEQPQGFEQKYLAMLSAGGTLRHKELLAPFGLDATDPQFWTKGLNVISQFIDELE